MSTSKIIFSGLALALVMTNSLSAAVAQDGKADSVCAEDRHVKTVEELFAMFEKQNSPSHGSGSGPKKAGTTKSPQGSKVAKATAVISSKAPKSHTSSVATAHQSPAQHYVAVSHSGQTALVVAKLDKSQYRPGDHMVVKVEALTDCNLLILDYDSKSTVTQIFPNQFDSSAKLHAGETLELGGDSGKYNLTINGKGKEHIFVYAYPANSAPLTVAMAPIANTPFRATSLTPDQYKMLVSQSVDYGKAARSAGERGVAIEPKDEAAESQRTKPGSSKVELDYEIVP